MPCVAIHTYQMLSNSLNQIQDCYVHCPQVAALKQGTKISDAACLLNGYNGRFFNEQRALQ